LFQNPTLGVFLVSASQASVNIYRTSFVLMPNLATNLTLMRCSKNYNYCCRCFANAAAFAASKHMSKLH